VTVITDLRHSVVIGAELLKRLRRPVLCFVFTSQALANIGIVHPYYKSNYEHLYSPNQATRQTENRLYTQRKEVKTKK